MPALETGTELGAAHDQRHLDGLTDLMRSTFSANSANWPKRRD
jgi:hypothetical protein